MWKTLGEKPAMVNPSLNEEWSKGPVFVDLVFTNLAKKDGFWEMGGYDLRPVRKGTKKKTQKNSRNKIKKRENTEKSKKQ